MNYILTNTAKIDGVYHPPGTVLDIQDKEIREQLMKTGAGKPTERKFSVDPAEAMVKGIKGLTKKMADVLVKNGVDTLDRLSGQSLKQLKGLGFTEKQAKVVYDNWTDEDK